jgi:hypothetical protein
MEQFVILLLVAFVIFGLYSLVNTDEPRITPEEMDEILRHHCFMPYWHFVENRLTYENWCKWCGQDRSDKYHN